MMNSAAYEAFRTVSAVNGNFARLAYLASMQDAPGLYRHWGLENEYGEEEVSRAFAHSHRVVLETILQTDISELVGDLKLGAQERGKTVSEFVHHLLSAPLVRTIGLPEHTEKHFNFVLQSLRSLALSRA